MPTDGFYEYLGSIEPYDTPFVVTATKAVPVGQGFGGYSSEDMYRQQMMRAYERALVGQSPEERQRLMNQFSQQMFATAYSGEWPCQTATTSNKVIIEPTLAVETPTKTVVERKRERRKVNYLYWLSVLVASIISIWPAWGPQALAGITRGDVGYNWMCRHHNHWIKGDETIHPRIQSGNYSYRSFRIETKDRHVRYVIGTHWVREDGGLLQIKNQQDGSVVWSVPDDQVVLLTEENEP